MRKEEDKNIITIEEEVRIPDTDIILEKGDKIRVIEAKKSEADDEKDDDKKDDDEKDDDKEPAEEKKKK